MSTSSQDKRRNFGTKKSLLCASSTSTVSHYSVLTPGNRPRDGRARPKRDKPFKTVILLPPKVGEFGLQPFLTRRANSLSFRFSHLFGDFGGWGNFSPQRGPQGFTAQENWCDKRPFI